MVGQSRSLSKAVGDKQQGYWGNSPQICMVKNVQERMTHVLYGGRVDWLLAIQRCDHGFESRWQWVRFSIIFAAVFRSFLIMSRWFPRVLPFPPQIKKAAEVKFEMITSSGGRLFAHFLSLCREIRI